MGFSSIADNIFNYIFFSSWRLRDWKRLYWLFPSLSLSLIEVQERQDEELLFLRSLKALENFRHKTSTQISFSPRLVCPLKRLFFAGSFEFIKQKTVQRKIKRKVVTERGEGDESRKIPSLYQEMGFGIESKRPRRIIFGARALSYKYNIFNNLKTNYVEKRKIN